MSHKSQLFLTFVVGIMIGLISWNIISLAEPTPIMADATGGATGGASNGYIAVSGAVTNAFSGLWIIKTTETDHSPSLCLYIPDNVRRIKFVAARRIDNDFKLISLNDSSELSPTRLKNELKRINEKEEKKKK